MGNSSSKGRPASCDCDEEENVELNNVITEPSIKRPVLLRQKSDQKSTNIPNTKKIKSDPHRKLIVVSIS